MSDGCLQGLDRGARQNPGDLDAQARLVLERVRRGREIRAQDLIIALRTQKREEVLNLLTGANIPENERAVLFVREIRNHYREARATLDYYELVDGDDLLAPDEAFVIEVLLDHLGSHPEHIEAIGQMQKPVLQLIPVYAHEGAGFQRMVEAIDAHRRGGQLDTTVDPDLAERWGMNEEVSPNHRRILGWQVAITEGQTVLPEESNPYAGQRLENQLEQWQQDCTRRGLRLCDKRAYALLKMQELRQSDEAIPLAEVGVFLCWTVLEDLSRESGSFVPGGYLLRSMSVSFLAIHPQTEGEIHPMDWPSTCRFRPSVVIDISNKLRFSRFLTQLPEQAQAALDLHDGLGWLRLGEDIPEAERDEAAPDVKRVMAILNSHLQNNEVHRMAIGRMEHPVVQLEPVFEEGLEGLGFIRLLQCFDSQRGDDRETNLVVSMGQGMFGLNRSPSLVVPMCQEALGIVDYFDKTGILNQRQISPEHFPRIIGWKIAVTEGVSVISENELIGQELHEQKRQWNSKYGSQGLHLPNPIRYLLLQMEGRSRGHIDPEHWSVLEEIDLVESWVSDGCWHANKVNISGYRPGSAGHNARYRPTVVIGVEQEIGDKGSDTNLASSLRGWLRGKMRELLGYFK